MLHDTPLNLSDLPVYQKALEIFTLSQNISMYLNKDLSDLKADGSEDEHIYFSGDIVQQSVSLVPEIMNAELQRCSDRKHILRSELKKFKKLQSSWMLTL